MTNENHKRKLIKTYSRRLEKLKEQQALRGINADPELLIEIEDLEIELDRLRKEVDILPRDKVKISPMQDKRKVYLPFPLLGGVIACVVVMVALLVTLRPTRPTPEPTTFSETVTPSRPSLIPGLLGAWNFDNCDGTDSSVNDYEANIRGEPNCVEGVSGKALFLNGQSLVALESLYNSINQFTDLSISVWFKTDNDELQTLVQSTTGNGSALPGYAIHISKGENDIEGKFITLNNNLDSVCEIHAKNFPNDFWQQWHNVVLVRDTTKQCGHGEGNLYIDGVFQGSCNSKVPPGIFSPESYVRIGHGVSASKDYYFTGIIDEIRMYNTALCNDEINNLYQQTKP